MAIRYGFKPSGCFVVVDTAFPWWSVAYDTSPLQRQAMKDPAAAARTALEGRELGLRLIRAMCGMRQHENREHWQTLQRFGAAELEG